RDTIVGPHALDWHRPTTTAGITQHGERPVGVPPPAVGEHWRRQQGLDQIVFRGGGPYEGEDAVQWEAVLLTQRQYNAVICGRRLQLEIKRQAEALADGQAPGAVDAAAKRRVQDELHATRFGKQALSDDRAVRRPQP